MLGKKKEDKELQKRNEMPLSKWGDVYEGFTDEDISEMQDATGTESKPESERRPPLYVYNLDTIDEAGNNIDKSLFYNAQSGEQFDHISCAFIGFREIRQRDKRDEALKQSIIYCRSMDKKTGMDMNTGELKNCETCPYRYGKQGKRKDCTQHMRFLGWDLERNQFFAIFFKRTGYVPMSNYMEKTFFGQYYNPKTNKRGDIPLYMLQTKITLKPEVGGGNKYYVPILECVGRIGKELVLDLLPAAQNFKKMMVAETFDQIEEDAKKKVGEEINNDDDVPF